LLTSPEEFAPGRGPGEIHDIMLNR